MLAGIENRLEQLLAAAEKMKEKERRQRMREETMEAQKAVQEERTRKALEQA